MGRTVLFFRYAGPLCADVLIEIRAIFIFRNAPSVLILIAALIVCDKARALLSRILTSARAYLKYMCSNVLHLTEIGNMEDK